MPGNVVKNGRTEIIEYLKSLGGSPLLNGDSWDPTKFDVAKIIQQEPYEGLLRMVGFQLKPTYQRSVHNFLTFEGPGKLDELTYPNYKEMLKEMFQFNILTSSNKTPLELNIDKAIENVKVFDQVS